jgi:hypothetical protein
MDGLKSGLLFQVENPVSLHDRLMQASVDLQEYIAHGFTALIHSQQALVIHLRDRYQRGER